MYDIIIHPSKFDEATKAEVIKLTEWINTGRTQQYYAAKFTEVYAADADSKTWWAISTYKDVWFIYEYNGAIYEIQANVKPDIIVAGKTLWSSTTYQQRLDLWLENLRSGVFNQAKHELQTVEGYCCLGVCTFMLNSDYNLLTDANCVNLSRSGRRLDGAVLEDITRLYYGISSDNGKFKYFDTINQLLANPVHPSEIRLDDTCLTAYNDAGATFSDLANIIASKPEGLFLFNF